MSVDYKKSNNGKCPVMHGGVTKAGESNTARLWPNSINLLGQSLAVFDSCLLYTSPSPRDAS